MTTLRIRLSAPPSPESACDWALHDASGARVRSGCDRPSGWPSATRVEVVIAASQVRIASVALPPVPSARVVSAATFALEDQLAGPPEAQHLAAGAQQPDGHVRVAIVGRALVAALTGAAIRRGPLARLGRVVVEPELAADFAGWRWCAGESDGGDGFVRRPDGSAFPVGAPGAGNRLPVELLLALDQARRDGAPPGEVRVDAAIDEAARVRWTSETRIPFSGGDAWRWREAPPSAFAGAIDLLQGDFALTPAAERGGRGRLFAPALVLASAALALHVVATLGEWSALKLDNWRQARAMASLATGAGIGPEAAAAPPTAYAALAHRRAELRHAQGLTAPDDALPLLAITAPALGALPPGSVRSATYVDGHWTMDLAQVDAALAGDLGSRLRLAGIPALVATSAAGTRVRIGGP